MDRELSSAFKKKRLIKIIALLWISFAVPVSTFYIFRAYIKPSIEREEISIETVDNGTIEATIPASGVIVPEYEFVITSPISAKIEQVMHHSGESLKKGEPIVQLNKDATLSTYTTLLDEQAVNHNNVDQLNLSLDRTISEMSTQYAIKEMNIQALETALDHERTLLKIGGSTEEKVKQAGLNFTTAKMELLQLKKQISNQEKNMRSQLKNLGIQMNIKNKSIMESDQKLHQAEVCAPAKGIITWISDKIGSEITAGAELVKVADLSSFKVEGKISDSSADQLKTGGKVIVKIDRLELSGKIVNIQPEVEEGMVKFFVKLDKNNSPALRSNLKADIFIVTSVKDNITRVKNGAAFTGADQQKVFVLHGATAVARPVKVGISNFNYIEIISGLKPGEQVIMSEMKEFVKADLVTIKN